jgi:hypothetical protein
MDNVSYNSDRKPNQTARMLVQLQKQNQPHSAMKDEENVLFCNEIVDMNQFKMMRIK